MFFFFADDFLCLGFSTVLKFCPVLYNHADYILSDQYLAWYLPGKILGFITQTFTGRSSPAAQ